MAYFLYYFYTCLYYKVCIRKKWPIFIVYLKWARILKKKYQRGQQMLNWFTRGHTNLELFSDCQTVFIWLSVHTALYTVCLCIKVERNLDRMLLLFAIEVHTTSTYLQQTLGKSLYYVYMHYWVVIGARFFLVSINIRVLNYSSTIKRLHYLWKRPRV